MSNLEIQQFHEMVQVLLCTLNIVLFPVLFLQPIPADELKSLCLEQLEIMSKKRIRRIIDGE